MQKKSISTTKTSYSFKLVRGEGSTTTMLLEARGREKTGEFESKNFKFVWKVDNVLKKLKNKKEALISPPYAVGSKGNVISCNVMLHSILREVFDEDFISMYVMFNNTDGNAVKNYHAKLAFIDTTGQEVCSQKSGFRSFDQTTIWAVHDFVKKDYFIEIKDQILVKGALSILCEIDINIYDDGEVNINATILNDYEALFLSEEFSDVTLLVDGQQIKVHKSILSARSKVFARMIKRDTDKESNTVKVDDVSFDVMKELLRFLYCGKVCCDKNLAKLLLVAAHKYDVALLKVECEKILLKRLKTKNACEILALSDFCNCEKLKNETINFTTLNLQQIKSTSGFKKLKESYPKLVEDILCKFTSQALTL